MSINDFRSTALHNCTLMVWENVNFSSMMVSKSMFQRENTGINILYSVQVNCTVSSLSECKVLSYISIHSHVCTAAYIASKVDNYKINMRQGLQL